MYIIDETLCAVSTAPLAATAAKGRNQYIHHWCFTMGSDFDSKLLFLGGDDLGYSDEVMELEPLLVSSLRVPGHSWGIGRLECRYSQKGITK